MLFWRVGKILELVPSKDGHTRTARVRMANGSIITRSISLLYPLEISEELENNISVQSRDSTESAASQRTILLQPENNQIKDLEKSPALQPNVQIAEEENSARVSDASRPVRKAAEIARENIRRCLTLAIINKIAH